MSSDIAALDRAALVFDPDYTPSDAAAGKATKRANPARNIVFERNEMTNLIGRILRSSGQPMTSAAIAGKIA